MKCSEVEKHLSEYMDGEIPQGLRLQMETHLSGCGPCRVKLESLRSTASVLGQTPKAVTPPDFIKRLHDRIEKETWTQKIRRTLFVPFQIKIPLELATAAALGLLIFFIAQPIQQHFLPKKHEEKRYNVTEKKMLLSSKSQSLEAELKPLAKSSAEKSEIGALKEEAPAAAATPEMSQEVREYKRQDLPSREQMIAHAPVMEPKPLQMKDESAPAPIVISLVAPSHKKDSAERLSAVEESAQATVETPNELAKRKSNALSGAASSLPQKAEGDAAIPAAPAPSASAETIDQKIIDLVHHLHGRLVSMERNEEGRPISMSIEIPRSNYEQFITRLHELGLFESPQDNISSSDDQIIPVIIRLNF